jgi:hypothetical protein
MAPVHRALCVGLTVTEGGPTPKRRPLMRQSGFIRSARKCCPRSNLNKRVPFPSTCVIVSVVAVQYPSVRPRVQAAVEHRLVPN